MKPYLHQPLRRGEDINNANKKAAIDETLLSCCQTELIFVCKEQRLSSLVLPLSGCVGPSEWPLAHVIPDLMTHNTS